MFTKYGENIPRCIAESEAVDLKKQNVIWSDVQFFTLL
jgi:hypothetical protein